MMSASELYLDLLKKNLTDTLEHVAPDTTRSGALYLRDFIQHFKRGRAYTLLPQVRIDSLQSCIEDVLSNRVPGDLLEAGVWRGGACIFMRGVLAAHGVTDRCVYVADSFEGLPPPDAEKFPKEAKAHTSKTMVELFRHFTASLEEVQTNFRRFGLLDEQVRFLKGWFSDTLPSAPIERLAILRLDADYYESTRQVLDTLYSRVSAGGYVIIDDYGEDEWTCCRQAVDDFRREHDITEPMIRVDAKCFFWKRSRA